MEVLGRMAIGVTVSLRKRGAEETDARCREKRESGKNGILIKGKALINIGERNEAV